MIFEIDENTTEGRTIIKQINKRKKNSKNGKGIYITAEEWKEQALQMVDDLFDEYEKGTL